MTKTIYLVSHGQTYFNYYHKVQGRCDSPLNEKGIRQVEATRDYFKKNNISFDKAFSSTQERASDTLEIITDHQMKYERLKDLREKCYGIFEGRDEFLLPWNYNNSNVDPMMELDEHVVARMKRAILEILDGMQDGETALVCGHGDILGQYVRAETEKSDFSGFSNAGVVKLTFEGHQAHFVSYVWPAEDVVMINLYLVRHGQTRFNCEHRMQGSSDSRLTKLGIKQLELLRDYFINHQIEFNKAYCSTQERASDSLEIITGHHTGYRRISEIKEKDYGFFEGKKNYWWLFHRLPFHPKVENNREVLARMQRGMNLILRDAQDGDNILIVGHGDSLTQYLRAKSNNHKFHNFHNGQFVKLTTDGQTIDFVDSKWPAKNIKH